MAWVNEIVSSSGINEGCYLLLLDLYYNVRETKVGRS